MTRYAVIKAGLLQFFEIFGMRNGVVTYHVVNPSVVSSTNFFSAVHYLHRSHIDSECRLQILSLLGQHTGKKNIGFHIDPCRKKYPDSLGTWRHIGTAYIGYTL
jgi:hypothetical protein